MTQAKPRFRTIEEYLDYDDGTDTRYELVNGELVEMAPENPINSTIAMFLAFAFAALGVPLNRFATGHQIEVTSADVTARQPDLTVHTEESLNALLSGEKLIRFEMPTPLLVVEVVSSSDTNKRSRERDYLEKPKEYAARGIPEFWQVDPSRSVVVVLTLKNEVYQAREFRGSDRVISPTFPDLQLTAEQILRAGQ
jgi:Uma2 family endonuclease